MRRKRSKSPSHFDTIKLKRSSFLHSRKNESLLKGDDGEEVATKLQAAFKAMQVSWFLIADADSHHAHVHVYCIRSCWCLPLLITMPMVL